jgi:hypothetical protein
MLTNVGTSQAYHGVICTVTSKQAETSKPAALCWWSPTNAKARPHPQQALQATPMLTQYPCCMQNAAITQHSA